MIPDRSLRGLGEPMRITQSSASACFRYEWILSKFGLKYHPNFDWHRISDFEAPGTNLAVAQ